MTRNKWTKPVPLSLATFAVLAIVALAPGCAFSRNTEYLLSVAGFKLVPADTPQRQTDLADLPTDQITRTLLDGVPCYLFPDPENNALYVGRQAQYDQYQKLFLQHQLAQAQVRAAEVNETYWGVYWPWGPGGGW
jgi:hypothetical protein